MNQFDETQLKKTTPWTLLSDKIAEKKQAENNTKTKVRERGKNLKVLPYLFAALTFAMVFLFSNQFKNLSADLFNSSNEGDEVLFGLPSQEAGTEETVTSTGVETGTGVTTGTGIVAEKTASVASTGAILEKEPLEVSKDVVITTAETVEVVPLNNFPAWAESVNKEIVVNEAIPASTVTETIPVNTVPVAETNSFRLNTHTYDKTTQTPVTANFTPLQLENLHNSAPSTQISNLPKAEQTVQSWPEEVVVFVISFVLSGLVWFGMRKLRA